MKKIPLMMIASATAAALFLTSCAGGSEKRQSGGADSISEESSEVSETPVSDVLPEADGENNGMTAESGGQSSDGPGSAGMPERAESENTESREEAMEMRMKIGDTEVNVEWEDNESVDALRELCRDQPLTIRMSMYGGFEQVGPLGTDLPSSDAQTTTGAGDIVLYSGDQIVVFYGSNSWAYTRLGRITDKTEDEMTELLSNGDVTVTITGESES